jgi:hypothetical protein
MKDAHKQEEKPAGAGSRVQNCQMKPTAKLSLKLPDINSVVDFDIRCQA